MKNYDDLQRFKEKTQTLDIAFKDMSGQSQEADQSQWALLRQLATDDEPELGSGQRIDLPQPQPIRGDEFSAAPEHAQSTPIVNTPAASSGRGSILDSLAAAAAAPAPAAAPASASTLFPPAQPTKTAPFVAPKATHVERQASTLFPPAKPAAAPTAPTAPAAPAAPAEHLATAETPVAPAPAASAPIPAPTEAQRPSETQPPAAAAPSRFGALFRSRPTEPANLAKETPLKPLLEKIALCR